MTSESLSLLWNAHAPAAISDTTTTNKKMKNCEKGMISQDPLETGRQSRLTVTNKHCDSLNAPQQPRNATMTRINPITKRMERPMQ